MNSAVEFLSGLLVKSRVRDNLDTSKMDLFSQTLHMVMCTHYQNHWFPEKPFKGSAYRCIRIVNQKMDPLVKEAGAQCGISSTDLQRVLPSELTMWVDPEEVSYRIGEEGSIGVLFDASESDNDGSSSDSNSTSSQEFLTSSPARSANCSPATTPARPSPTAATPVTRPQMPALGDFESHVTVDPQQQYHYHQQQQQQEQVQQAQSQDYFPNGCKNEWFRGYLPTNMSSISNVNSQENHLPSFEYLSSAFVSS